MAIYNLLLSSERLLARSPLCSPLNISIRQSGLGPGDQGLEVWGHDESCFRFTDALLLGFVRKNEREVGEKGSNKTLSDCRFSFRFRVECQILKMHSGISIPQCWLYAGYL